MTAVDDNKPWVVYRYWIGQASTMVPQRTHHRFTSRSEAVQFAADLTAGVADVGTWFEARRENPRG